MNLTPGPARGSQRFHVAYDIASVIDGTQLSDSRQFIILATVHSLQDRPRIFGAISGRRPEKLRAEVKSASSRSGSNMYPESSAIENTRVVRKKSRVFHGERNGLPKFRNRGQCYCQFRGSADAGGHSPHRQTWGVSHTCTPLRL